jgi:polyisoprenoid-binding protein YceI
MTKLDVTIPVAKMKSEHSGLDKNLQKALNAVEYPNIVFNMSHYTVRSSTNNADDFIIEAAGTLEVAGAKRQVTLEGTAKEKDGLLEITGAKELLMTDFGVKPPKIMMIKTANRVVIHYDLLLK